MKKQRLVNWNLSYIKDAKKEDFIKDHQHLKDFGVDLEGEWNRLRPEQKKEK